MPGAVSILHVREMTELKNFGKTVTTMRVTYMVGDDGPFSRDYPPENFDSDQIRRDIEDHGRRLDRIRG